MAILIALQQRPATAQALADRLEVSKRTVIRDMQSLAEMGVPLYTVPGPSGGYRLMDGFQLPPLQMDDQEALTVLLALQAMTKMGDTPFNRARWTVMDKIRAVLPERTRTEIEAMLGQLELQVPERKVKAALLPLLIDAVKAGGRRIRALYRSANHRRWVTLVPSRVYAAYGFWYCEAYSETHEEVRSFRADRFDELEEDGEGEVTGGNGDASEVEAVMQVRLRR